MRWQSELSFDLSQPLTLLAAPAGAARRERVAQWLAEASQRGRAVWILPCDRRAMGPWAGLIELFGDLVPRLSSAAPELLVKHDYELAIVMPVLERVLAVRNPTLTDVSSDNERTRNYPADRAYRIVHGLIDLLASAQQVLSDPPYALAFDDVEHAGALVQMFITELVRRRADRMGLAVLVTAEPAAIDQVLERLPALQVGVRVEGQRDAPAAVSEPRTAAMHAQRGAALERQAEQDAFERQALLPQLIHAWLHSDEPARALPYQLEAFSLYNTRGFYEDALFYGRPALEALERYTPDALMDRMNVCVKLYSSYIGLKQPEDAERIADTAMAYTDNPRLLGQWRYMKAMLYARFLPQRDFARAERELDQGYGELEASTLAPHKKAFLMAFNRNGLALIRHQQGRPEEAIELCRWAYQHLASQLEQKEHQLHRSVLVYNIAQVYQAMGNHDEAIRHLSEAVEADSNYSEYYNERGNLYFKLERHEEAITDYLQAIDRSPPYMEVWTNLGQCYVAVGRITDAVEAYSRALDLAPAAALALTGRAQAYDRLGDRAAAIADYDALLALDPDQPAVLANRAALYYEAAQLERALADLDRAIVLAPDMGDLYENRAVALRALGRLDHADRDAAIAARLAHA